MDPADCPGGKQASLVTLMCYRHGTLLDGFFGFFVSPYLLQSLFKMKYRPLSHFVVKLLENCDLE